MKETKRFLCLTTQQVVVHLPANVENCCIFFLLEKDKDSRIAQYKTKNTRKLYTLILVDATLGSTCTLIYIYINIKCRSKDIGQKYHYSLFSNSKESGEFKDNKCTVILIKKFNDKIKSLRNSLKF